MHSTRHLGQTVTAPNIGALSELADPVRTVHSVGDASSMPTISRFYGIVIRMYFTDHAPPHFHAVYSGAEASIAIATGEVLRGELPDRALRLVREWMAIHRDELDANWARIQEPAQPLPIEPLK